MKEYVPSAGEPVGVACKRLAELAVKESVFMIFNGTRVEAQPGEDANTIGDRWWTDRERFQRERKDATLQAKFALAKRVTEIKFELVIDGKRQIAIFVRRAKIDDLFTADNETLSAWLRSFVENTKSCALWCCVCHRPFMAKPKQGQSLLKGASDWQYAKGGKLLCSNECADEHDKKTSSSIGVHGRGRR